MTTEDDPVAVESELKQLMDKVAGAKGDQSSWPATVALLAVFVIVLAVLGIKLALTKRKAAQLASDLRRAQEEKIAAEENAKLAANEMMRKDAEEMIKDAQARAETLNNELDAHKVTHDEYVKQLQSISSWEELVVVDGRDGQ